MSSPMMIKNGKMYPITQAEYDAQRRASFPRSAASRPGAPTPAARPAAPKAEKVDYRALSRKNMLKQAAAQGGELGRKAKLMLADAE